MVFMVSDGPSACVAIFCFGIIGVFNIIKIEKKIKFLKIGEWLTIQ